MNDFTRCYGEWGLVAGAAEGLGASFSESLAKRGMNLVMVDNKPGTLQAEASKIRSEFDVRVIEAAEDLLSPEAWKHCMDLVKDLDCRLLVYVPAYSPVKYFLDNSDEELDRYIRLNAMTPLHLVHAFAGHLKKNNGGGILLMSSLAGLLGPQFSAPYAATKAFNILLAESLHYELKRSGIRVSACCAGPTDTPTFRSSSPQGKNPWPGVMDPGVVADYALTRLGKKAVLIPGWKNRITFSALTRLFPRKIAAGFVSKGMRMMYGGKLAN
jgi:uncharacterized protein